MLNDTKFPKWLLIALFCGLVLRFISINQSLWMDESISAYAAKNFSYLGIVNEFIPSDTHPPLYYLTLKLWASFFGFSELSLRVPSVIFGVLTIYFTYKIALTFSKKAALIVSFLTAFSPLLIYYSHEVRMYSLSTLLVTFCMWSFLKSYWLGLSVGLLLLGITDYFPLIILVPVWIQFWVRRKEINSALFLISHVPLLIFLTLWFPILSLQSKETMSFVSNMPGFAEILGVSGLKNLALVWVKSLIGRINFSPSYLYALVVGFISLLVSIPLWFSGKENRKLSLFWLWYILPILISFIFAFKIPGFSYFRLLFTLPALLILISYGLTKINKTKIFLGLLLFSELLFSIIYLFNKNYWREDWKTAVPFIENRLKENEKVVISYKESFTPYEWYSKRVGFVQTFNDTFDSNNKLDNDIPGIYTLDYLMDLTDPERKNYEALKKNSYTEQAVFNFRGVGQVRYWTK